MKNDNVLHIRHDCVIINVAINTVNEIKYQRSNVMKKLLVLDSNSILNRAFYGIRALSAPDGTPTNAVYGFLNILIKLINDNQPDYIFAAFDLKAPTFRHKMYSGYKANRKGMPDELAAQMPIAKELLSLMNIPILQLEGYEADDIIGTVSRICGENSLQCLIATGDRDDLQLAGGGTTVILTSTKSGHTVTELYDEQAVKDKYGVTPAEFVDLKALMGDTSDNIPGVSGIGEKTASKLISQYSGIEYIYDNIDSIDVTERIKGKLRDGRDDAFLSKKLAQIDTNVPIDVDIDSGAFSGSFSGSGPELYNQLLRLGLKSTIKRMDLTPGGSVTVAGATGFFDSKKLVRVSSVQELREAAESLGSIISVYLDIHGSSVSGAAVSDGETAYYTDPSLSDDAVTDALKPVLSDENVKKYVCGIKDAIVSLHGRTEIKGIAFDCAIAAYLADPSKTYDVDSIASGYLGIYIESSDSAQLSLFDDEKASDLNGKYALIIFELQRILSELIEKNDQHFLYYEVELPLIETLASMQILGFRLDTDEIQRFGDMLSKRINALEAEIYDRAGEQFNINSPKQLGVILFEKLGLPGGKKTKNGYSTKAEILEKLKWEHPIINNILDYRTYSKLKSTYCDGLTALVDPDTHRIHSIFNQTATVTGRLSSAEPNLQNIPTRTELGRELRKMFIAKEGCVLIDADYSQIELRILAHLSQDETMIEAFKNGADIHAVTASRILNVPIDELTKEQRSSAKAINFGIIYGMGEYTLAQDLGITYKQAKQYMTDYFNKYSSVRKYLDSEKAYAHEHGYVKTIMNRIRYIPELNSSQAQLRQFGERAAMNTPVQGSAADIIKLAMVRVYKRLRDEGLEAKLILQVHDELIIETPAAETVSVREILKQEMEGAVKLAVPLTIDMAEGTSWYDAK